MYKIPEECVELIINTRKVYELCFIPIDRRYNCLQHLGYFKDKKALKSFKKKDILKQRSKGYKINIHWLNLGPVDNLYGYSYLTNKINKHSNITQYKIKLTDLKINKISSLVDICANLVANKKLIKNIMRKIYVIGLYKFPQAIRYDQIVNPQLNSQYKEIYCEFYDIKKIAHRRLNRLKYLLANSNEIFMIKYFENPYTKLDISTTIHHHAEIFQPVKMNEYDEDKFFIYDLKSLEIYQKIIPLVAKKLDIKPCVNFLACAKFTFKYYKSIMSILIEQDFNIKLELTDTSLKEYFYVFRELQLLKNKGVKKFEDHITYKTIQKNKYPIIHYNSVKES